MISLLAKKFIKNREDVTSPAVRQAYGMLCGIVGIGFNVLLFALKLIAGTLSGSIAVMAMEPESVPAPSPSRRTPSTTSPMRARAL